MYIRTQHALAVGVSEDGLFDGLSGGDKANGAIQKVVLRALS